MTANNGHIKSEFADSVLEGQCLASASFLTFRDPNNFVAGELHSHVQAWSQIAEKVPSYPLASEILNWIQGKVKVADYFVPFKGSYKGQEYDCARPPAKVFANHLSCRPFAEFVSRTIIERLRSGAISLWGKVGEAVPPHLVLPLTVEPSKPRLCNDDRFLNLWMADRPFQLDTLKDLTRYVSKGSYQAVCDDKSGYDHIMLSETCRTYFGFQWGGWFFVSNCIPFGWKLSAYIYHSTGSLVSHFLRSKGIPCSLYIDDRHMSHLMFAPHATCSAYQALSEEESNLARADAAVFFTCYTLISLGYTIGLSKSTLKPSKVVPYLGFLCDANLQAFTLLPHKKEKFLRQLKSVLAKPQIELVTLQRLAGKCLSMALAVPGARIFTNEINLAISRSTKSTRASRLEGALRSELESWLFLESWSGVVPWRSEHHRHIELFSDASAYGWGGFLSHDAVSVEISDYWEQPTCSKDIVVKETLALANVLMAFGDSISNSWVDVFTDSQVLVKAWQRQGARSQAFSSALKKVFLAMSSLNIDLHLFHIPGECNPADQPSRRLSLQDARLSDTLWKSIQQQFGGERGHSVDLMALPSNARTDLEGRILPFFSPYPCPFCSGVNIFAQMVQPSTIGLFENPYVFPPIGLIAPVLEFLKSLHLSFTMVVPDVLPRRHWWPVLCAISESRALLAPARSVGALLVPSKEGYRDNWPLPWDLWVFRVLPH